MVRKKKKIHKTERYEISCHDWEVYHHLNAQKNMLDFADGIYWEGSSVSFMGNLKSPKIKTANKVEIIINSDPQKDEHWKITRQDDKTEIIGFMEIPRQDKTLRINVWLPNRIFQNILLSLNQNKIRYASVFGEKLKWRKGRVYSISLSTKCEDDE